MPKKIKPFTFIAGPCVLEDKSSALKIAKRLKSIAESLELPFIFKASYDKANRTSINSYRGPGLRVGLEILYEIKSKLNIAVTSDIHLVEEAEPASKVLDIIQVPAFLCRQTDLISAAAATGRTINVKKGQFLSPLEIQPIADKLKEAGCKKYYITERGSSFGYQNLVVDMRSLIWMREQGHPVIFDATHSVQRPGALGQATGGDGAMAPHLARAALATGVDGLFMETHPKPSQSPSDGANMIPLALLPKILRKLKIIHEASQS
ncbi:MAG: 3-deoxy-8-phosphooctulonate synthase [Verrucomicrobiota bacterium]